MNRYPVVFRPSYASYAPYVPYVPHGRGQAYGDGVFETIGDWFTSDSIDYSYEKLWMLPNSKRDASLVGIISYQDSVIQVALGAKAGTDSLERLDDRATIRGGLEALYLAGLTDKDPTGLWVGLTDNAEDETALIKAAGVSTKGDRRKNLAKAAQKVRKEVKKKGGKPLMRVAWALRAISMMKTTGVLGAVRAGVATIAGLAATAVATPVAGAIVGGVLGGLSSVTQQRMAGQVEKFTAVAQKNLERFAVKQEEKQAKEAAKAEQAALDAAQKQKISALRKSPGGEGFFGIPWWGWVVGGVALAGTVYVIRK